MNPFVYAAYFLFFSISFGQEVYPRKMRDKVRQQQLQLQMAQLYAPDQVRCIHVDESCLVICVYNTESFGCAVVVNFNSACCSLLVYYLLFQYRIRLDTVHKGFESSSKYP